MGCVIWRRKLHRSWPAWIVYNLVVLNSFLCLFALSTGNQSAGCLWEMQLFWHDVPFRRWASPGCFPDGSSRSTRACCSGIPSAVRTGAARSHCWSVESGVGVFVARRQVALLAVCLCPLVLNFVAAAMHRYPYGGHIRLAMYFAPACCLLAGLGTSAALAWLHSRRGVGARVAVAILILLTLVPVGSAVRDLWCPYRAYHDVLARDFARWFWPTGESAAEVACLKTDLAANFQPENYRMRYSAIYLCNQRIYSPASRRAQGGRLGADLARPAPVVRAVSFLRSSVTSTRPSVSGWPTCGRVSTWPLPSVIPFPLSNGAARRTMIISRSTSSSPGRWSRVGRRKAFRRAWRLRPTAPVA